MNPKLRQELESAIKSAVPLTELVDVLRRCKDQGVSRQEVYSLLEALHHDATDEELDDRILEVADFVAGFSSPHMRVWENEQ